MRWMRADHDAGVHRGKRGVNAMRCTSRNDDRRGGVDGNVACAGAAEPESEPVPLAAPAGVDSKARQTPPPGAVNQGAFDAATWKYGNAFAPPPDAKIWNP